MPIDVMIAIAFNIVMILLWLVHIAVAWHWDFKEWYHSSDEDI